MQVQSIDRVLIAVRNLPDARETYEARFGTDFSDPFESTVETTAGDQRSMITYGHPGLELIAPVEEDSALARYLNENGPGLFGIVFRVADIDAAASHLADLGIDPIAEEQTDGTLEHHYHPKDFGGVYTIFTEYQHPMLRQ